ncbi:hypothetical protein MCOR08_001624 [Pyricularia oryzae]|nr:hypothetical protein MCOR09_001002 [Pyricularia oryzae]KAI6640386.1 hypothetical protein MCOR08_001624 [Pyricularia oryzae]
MVENKETFTMKEVPIENTRCMTVRVIGAGFSGILSAIRIPEKIRNVDLVVYEKSDGIGGAWWLNRYPGVACDIISHSYQYTFAPNPNWSKVYAPGQEIQEYLQGVAERFGATRFIKTSHEVKHCAWDSNKKKWILKVAKLPSGEVFDDETDILVTARGQLHEPLWPDIPGLDTFEGKVMHSAEWDTSLDYRHKKVGVIGIGSSAIQIIPSLQRLDGVKLSVFMRSKTWIAPSFGNEAMASMGFQETTTEFPKETQDLFKKDPKAWLRFRKAVEDSANIHSLMLPDSELHRAVRQGMYNMMQARLAKRPGLFERLVAEFSPGCRRITPGPGFLEALTEDNVELIDDRIVRVTETGVVLASGREMADLDVLVCATGFRTSDAPLFPIVGRDGLTLEQRWKPRMESYLSVAVDGFPNLLMQFGPSSAIGFGSLVKMLEAECDYVVKVIRKLQREDYATIEPRVERVRDFTQFANAYFSRTVHKDDCKSQYRSEGGWGKEVVGLWPGSPQHTVEALRSPRWEDFIFESADPTGNMLRWFGNGWSLTETEGDPSWYLNPEEVDFPTEGRPEENPRYKNRPWSY